MKVYIRTYGCQMNERDSEAAAAMLSARGFALTNDEEDADILIFNTCSVREQAERKAIGKLGILQRLKRRRPDIYIGVMGCMAQRLGNRLLKKLPHVDFVIGTEQLHRLPEVIEAEIAARHPEVRTGSDHAVLTGLSSHLAEKSDSISAFIAIMRGCNRFCSYCIVPYVRGREKSRTIPDIVAEAESLVNAGIKEIMLLGQNVAAFGLDGKATPPDPEESPFGDLLRELDKLPGLLRIRFTSPHPAYFNMGLVKAIGECKKVCNSVHLPLQSGSDSILEIMNRRYTSAQYLDIVNNLKKLVQGITFSTDIIVGFPGETEDDFNATRGLMNEVGFDNAFIFKYSPREGTKAAEMEDSVPKEVKEERNQLLLADLSKRAGAHNRALVGETVEILVEGPSKRNSERWAGRTTTNKVVIFTPKPETSPGDLIKIKIGRATTMSLFQGVSLD